MLKSKNPHERDSRIIFDEEPHIYYIDGQAYKRSVTSFIHNLFPSFDSDKVSHLVHKKHFSNPNSEYFQKSANDIKLMWAQTGKEASSEGTKMHKAIEDHFNGLDVCCDSIEFTYFKNWLKDFPELKPYRSEWEVFQEDHKIAGSIDMLFENEDSTLTIYDWKRCKNIRLENQYEYGLGNANRLQNCNFVHYSLQLNTYKYFLESKYNKTVRDMYLLILHPSNNNYKRFQVPDMQSDVMKFLT